MQEQCKIETKQLNSMGK